MVEAFYTLNREADQGEKAFRRPHDVTIRSFPPHYLLLWHFSPCRQCLWCVGPGMLERVVSLLYRGDHEQGDVPSSHNKEARARKEHDNMEMV